VHLEAAHADFGVPLCGGQQIQYSSTGFSVTKPICHPLRVFKGSWLFPVFPESYDRGEPSVPRLGVSVMVLLRLSAWLANVSLCGHPSVCVYVPISSHTGIGPL
jgi:hypothetical protein